MIKRVLFSMAIITLMFALNNERMNAQEQRFELGGHFSLLRTSISRGSATVINCVTIPCTPPATFTKDRITEPGFGARIGYNISEYVTLEAEGNFFPRDRDSDGGQKIQGLFGVKAGKRWESVGLFAKARPGFMRFSKGDLRLPANTACIAIFPTPAGCFETTARTFFNVDLGGVVEVYPSKRTFVRFDGGDTVIRLGERNVVGVLSPPPGVLSPTRLVVLRAPSETTHNFQGAVGVGFRF